jgi:hypothetical protein
MSATARAGGSAFGCGPEHGRFRQHPDGVAGAETPGVAGAPVALAGVIMPGVARFIVTLSAQADVFGVGITAMAGFGAIAAAVGSMLVPPRSATAGSIVPSGGFAGICGVDSGKAAPLVGGPPGVELHTVVEALPSGDTGDRVPVVLATTGVGMVPSGVPDIIADDDGIVIDGVIVAVLPTADVATVPGAAAGAATEGANSGDVVAIDATGMVEPGIVDRNDVAGCADSANGAVELAAVDVGAADGTGAAETDAVVAVVPAMTDVEATDTVGVGGPICPVGVEQVTTVPGVDGSDASGTGAKVVSGVPGWVIAENGLGPLSGEDSIVPGVDDRPMAVVPMVETCARLALQPERRTAAVNSRCRMRWPPPLPVSSSAPCCCAPRPCCLP